MRELVAIKVKIGIDNYGHAKYPNFNSISFDTRKGLDWSKYIDIHGTGWHYDNESGHEDDTNDSPYGQQWGMILVPEDFANAAVSLFPDEVSFMNETQIEDFYNNKFAIKLEEEIIDNEKLTSIKLKKDLGLELTKNQLKALDPNNDTPGIIKNKKKKWQDFKTIKKISIKEL